MANLWLYVWRSVIGGFSGGAGAEIAASGGILSNTMSIVVSFYANSIGMSALSGGMIDQSISFGSYNFGTGEFNYFLDGDNKWYEDVGYGFGGLANIQDVFSLNMGGYAEYNSLKDIIGHASLTNENKTINISKGFESGSLLWGKGKMWPTASDNQLFPKIKFYNINEKLLEWMTKNIGNDKGILGFSELNYSIVGNTCASQVSRALWLSGVWGTNPFTLSPHSLYVQLITRQVGVYSSPYLYQISN